MLQGLSYANIAIPGQDGRPLLPAASTPSSTFEDSHCIIMLDPAEEQNNPPKKKLRTGETTDTAPTSGRCDVATQWGSVYIESEELKHQSWSHRRNAWLAWREGRREDRRFAFARLRDALALQDSDMIDKWKACVVEPGPGDPIESMSSFEKTP